MGRVAFGGSSPLPGRFPALGLGGVLCCFSLVGCVLVFCWFALVVGGRCFSAPVAVLFFPAGLLCACSAGRLLSLPLLSLSFFLSPLSSWLLPGFSSSPGSFFLLAKIKSPQNKNPRLSKPTADYGEGTPRISAVVSLFGGNLYFSVKLAYFQTSKILVYPKL